MYERFTDNAREVMRIANQEARRLRHAMIETEHILLAIAKHGDGVAIAVLTSLGIAIPQISDVVHSLVEQGDHESVGKVPLSSCTRRVIELAMEEARNAHHCYVGTEHLLLGVLRAKGAAAEALSRWRVDSDAVRQGMLEVLDTPDYHQRNQECARQIARGMKLSRGLQALGVLLVILAVVSVIRGLL